MASEKKGSKGSEKPVAAKPSEKKAESREGKLYTLRSSAQRAAKEDGLIPGQFDIVAVKKNGKEEFKYVYSESYRSMKEQMAPAGEKEPPSHAEQVKDTVAPQILPELAPKAEPHQKAMEVAAKVEPTLPTGPVKKQLTPKEQYEQDIADANRRRQAEAEAAKKLEVKDETVSTPVAPGQPPITTPTKPAPTGLKCSACGEVLPDKPSFQKHAQEKHGVKPKGKDSWLHRSEIESPTKAVWAIADEMRAANPKITRKEVIAECERRGIAHWTARTQYQAWLTANRESEANAAKANGNHGKK